MTKRRPSYCRACDEEIPEREPKYVLMGIAKHHRVAQGFNGYCSEECWDVHTRARDAALKAFGLDWKAKQEGREKCPTCERWLR